MERLTLDNAIKYIKDVARKNRINKEKNTIIIPNSFISSNDCADKYGQVAKWLEELKSYKDLEEQGLLVRLPCKVGTEVFCYFPGDSHYTKCQIKKNRNLSKHIWKYMLLCRVSCTKGTLLQIL